MTDRIVHRLTFDCWERDLGELLITLECVCGERLAEFTEPPTLDALNRLARTVDGGLHQTTIEETRYFTEAQLLDVTIGGGAHFTCPAPPAALSEENQP